ncbi:hypothetical protein G6F56_001673 [Rhizopus delemar]|nr:hypothetical protein G6F56_001673 [Rhizopus delemar]
MGFCYDNNSYAKQYEFEGRKQIETFLNIYKLSQYYETFIDEGFDQIPCLLDITESDLVSLNVKRGHRRLLQRAIATARGVPISSPITIESETMVHRRRRRWTASKPFTSFDTFLTQIEADSRGILLAEDALELANYRWNQLTDAERQYYERQAFIANGN